MKFLRVVCCLLLPVFSLAQVNPLFLEPTKKQADSLRKALDQNINDTLRMAANRELALYYLDINTDSAIYFIEKDLPLARKLQLKLWEADALDLLGIFVSNQGNFVKAIKSINEAIQIVENKECEKNIWNISKFTNSGVPEDARLSLLATIRSDVSGIYRKTGNIEKEMYTLQECIKIANRIHDNTILSQAYRDLGSKYFQENRLDSALVFLSKSLACSDLSGYNKYRSSTYNLIGRIYLKKNENEPAFENFLKGLQYAQKQNNNAGIGDSYIAIGGYYNQAGNYDSALFYAQSGLAIGQRTGRVYTMIDAYNLLVSIHKNRNRPDSALIYLQLATTAKDSLMSLEKIKQLQNIGFDEQLRLQELEKESLQTKSKIRIYSLLGGLGILLLVALLLYRNNRQKQKTNKALESALSGLKAAQSQLVQSEKMASLGELTAGIAHEIQNPLNFVNNFSEVNNELIDEVKSQKAKLKSEELDDLLNDIYQNNEKISHHGRRADAIVKGMLQHSRSSNGVKEPTDINALCDEYLRLAYHGLRAKDPSFNVEINTDFDTSVGNVNVVQQDIGRVLLNLINNAFYAAPLPPARGFSDPGYSHTPTVWVNTKKVGDNVFISVQDNGPGIPEKILGKIFQPFFTTKPTGQGTGLGLSLSYDIVKAHGGEIIVNTKENEGTEFIIKLPA